MYGITYFSLIKFLHMGVNIIVGITENNIRKLTLEKKINFICGLTV